MSFRASNHAKYFRRIKRRWAKLTSRKNKLVLKRYGLLVAIGAIVLTVSIAERTMINMNYSNLLTTIARGESLGNYNAYYGNPTNSQTKFTSMTVNEVMQWQDTYVKQGSPSSAVGKYQFIGPTLAGLVAENNIDPSEKFDQALQDRLAIKLLERRGIKDYARGRISREQLAHNLSKEWAALPKVIGDNPNASYYDGDGLNTVQVSVGEVLAAIDSLKKPTKTT